MTRKAKRAVGRPPKFTETRRPVTVTLPHRILKLLEGVSSDRAKAICKVVETMVGGEEKMATGINEVEITKGKAVIIVPFIRCLSRIGLVRLVEIAPMKHLISIPSGTSVEMLEVALSDALDTQTDIEVGERELVEALIQRVRISRRRGSMSKEEILLVDVEEGRVVHNKHIQDLPCAE